MKNDEVISLRRVSSFYILHFGAKAAWRCASRRSPSCVQTFDSGLQKNGRVFLSF
jgi:hypothetical protein